MTQAEGEFDVLAIIENRKKKREREGREEEAPTPVESWGNRPTGSLVRRTGPANKTKYLQKAQV